MVNTLATRVLDALSVVTNPGQAAANMALSTVADMADPTGAARLSDLRVKEQAAPGSAYGELAGDFLFEAAMIYVGVKGSGSAESKALSARTAEKASTVEKAKLTIDETRTDHIFRDSEGHFLRDTQENRAAIEDTANNRGSFNGTDGYGNDWYSEMNSDGTQTWAEVRDGDITNGGINLNP